MIRSLQGAGPIIAGMTKYSNLSQADMAEGEFANRFSTPAYHVPCYKP